VIDQVLLQEELVLRGFRAGELLVKPPAVVDDVLMARMIVSPSRIVTSPFLKN